jgi:hypothetical protein
MDLTFPSFIALNVLIFPDGTYLRIAGSLKLCLDVFEDKGGGGRERVERGQETKSKTERLRFHDHSRVTGFLSSR